MEVFVISLLNGLVYGMLLFMLASGLTLIFSMMGVLNFAHASIYMLGAYLAFQVSQVLGFFPALVIAPLLCAAIGAAISFPGRQVISMVGDGGFMMTGQELATAFHHGAAPIVLVFNNNQFGTIRMHQERAYPWRITGTQVTNPDFAKYIEAFGGHGEVVIDTAAFAPAFRRAVASGKPALIELRMNPEQISTRATVADLRAGKTPPSNP